MELECDITHSIYYQLSTYLLCIPLLHHHHQHCTVCFSVTMTYDIFYILYVIKVISLYLYSYTFENVCATRDAITQNSNQRFFFDFYRNSILILIYIYLYIVPRNPTCVVSDINIIILLKIASKKPHHIWLILFNFSSFFHTNILELIKE